jgi:hypothetical protein
MAKVALPGGSLGSVNVQIGGAAAAALTDGTMVKRKTPSELRVSFQLSIMCFTARLEPILC